VPLPRRHESRFIAGAASGGPRFRGDDPVACNAAPYAATVVPGALLAPVMKATASDMV